MSILQFDGAQKEKGVPNGITQENLGISVQGGIGAGPQAPQPGKSKGMGGRW